MFETMLHITVAQYEKRWQTQKMQEDKAGHMQRYGKHLIEAIFLQNIE